MNRARRPVIVEAFLQLTARTEPRLRRLGLVGDAVAVWSRGRRHRGAWTPHEARCREAVLSAVADLPRRRTVAILGSGLLRDVPLDALLANFERAILVDAVHLRPARRAARDPRVVWRVGDLSGAAGLRDGTARDLADPLASIRGEADVDLAISANVLSQLAMPFDDRPDLARRIVEAHLDALRNLPCRVCLMTDIAYRERGRDGRDGAPIDLLHGVALPPPQSSWDWTVAPLGEASRRAAFIHRVHAYPDLHAAFARAAPADGSLAHVA